MVEPHPIPLLAWEAKSESNGTPTRRKALTKQEFIKKVADRSGLTDRDAGKAVDAFMEAVTETLKS